MTSTHRPPRPRSAVGALLAPLVLASGSLLAVPTAASAAPLAAAPIDDPGLLAHYEFDDLTPTDGSTVADTSGNDNAATVRGSGATVDGDSLELPGGGSGSDAAFVSLPTGLVDGQDTLSISMWLRNETGNGNYAAAFLGTPQSPPTSYWLLNPANPSGRLKSVMTGAVSPGSPWTTERGISPTNAALGIPGPVTDDDWALHTTVIEPGSITAYVDEEQVGTVEVQRSISDYGSDLVGYLGRSSYADPRYAGGIRDVRISTSAYTADDVAALVDADRVEQDAAALSLPGSTATDLTLPSTGPSGSSITWATSDADVITADGAVTRPTGDDVDVTLTATITSGEASTTREVVVTVLADDPARDVQRVSEAFDLGIAVVTDDLVLRESVEGVDLAWSSSNPDVIAADGTVTRPGVDADAAEVTLTATFTRGEASAERSWTVRVLPADRGRIGAYIGTGDTNRTDVVHLARSADGTSYTALNDGDPVLYPTPGNARLGDPVVFRRPDGSFGLAATENSASSTLYVWSSENLVDYTDQRRVALPGGITATDVAVRYDNAAGAYQVRLTTADGTVETTTTDFESFTAPTPADDAIEAEGGSFPAGAQEPSSIGVTAEEWSDVVDSLSEIRNTGVEAPADVTVAAGEEVTLPESVTATYSNDAQPVEMAVEWDADDLAAARSGEPGTYTVDGTVQAPTYPDKLVDQRADPDVTLGDDGAYYLTASYPQKGADPEGYDRVILRRSETIAGLGDAEEVTLWDEADSALQKYVWAPELTKIGDTWYIMFTASRSSNVFDIRPMLLEHTGGDLMDPASWVEVGPMLAQDGDRAFTSFSLDMHHFELNGRDYVTWAQADPDSALLMAEIDADNPRQLISPTMQLAYPRFAWEGNQATRQYVDEGAATVVRDGRLWVSFSASTVDEKYSVGLISAPVDADLLDPASWRKTGYPVLTSADTPEQAGPGHNSFTTDELGNTVIVYHSRTISEIIDGGLTDPGRHARARTVVFDHRGQPVFTVVGDDLLDPANASVSVQVRVEGDEAPAPVTPTITGDAATGHTLTADTGDWGEAAELTYQWFVDGEPVQGATDATFDVRPPMVGSRITVTVTGTTDDADPVSLTSEPTARVARTSTPQIAGAAKVGKTVRAVPRTWTPGTTFEYRWLADGETIAGATDDRLTLGADLKGAEVVVEVTGTKDGYATVSERSEAAGPVR